RQGRSPLRTPTEIETPLIHGARGRGRGRRRRTSGGRRRLLAVLPLVPLLRPLLERAGAVTVAPSAAGAPAAAHHPASGEAPEGQSEQPEDAEQDQQEPEDPEEGEERVEAKAAVIRSGRDG